MGFPDACIPLPADADDAEIASLCQNHTARLHAWIDEQKRAAAAAGVDPKLRTRYDAP